MIYRILRKLDLNKDDIYILGFRKYYKVYYKFYRKNGIIIYKKDIKCVKIKNIIDKYGNESIGFEIETDAEIIEEIMNTFANQIVDYKKFKECYRKW